jgi:hypothetical protein
VSESHLADDCLTLGSNSNLLHTVTTWTRLSSGLQRLSNMATKCPLRCQCEGLRSGLESGFSLSTGVGCGMLLRLCRARTHIAQCGGNTGMEAMGEGRKL